MRTRIERFGAVTGLLLAIFNDLRRRAWWAYRTRGSHNPEPRVTVIAQRPDEWRSYVPRVTTPWQSVVEHALPIQATALHISAAGDIVPILWLDASARPDIADLPRVLDREGSEPPIILTQWLADRESRNTAFVVTFIEPVRCTSAVHFNIMRRQKILEYIVAAGRVMLALDQPAPTTVNDQDQLCMLELPPAHIVVPVETTSQLQAILTAALHDPSTG